MHQEWRELGFHLTKDYAARLQGIITLPEGDLRLIRRVPARTYLYSRRGNSFRITMTERHGVIPLLDCFGFRMNSANEAMDAVEMVPALPGTEPGAGFEGPRRYGQWLCYLSGRVSSPWLYVHGVFDFFNERFRSRPEASVTQLRA
jgi:hypothetical protein